MDNIFEKATRQKVRFETSKGALTVEQLWDLPLTATTPVPNLDDIARDLHKQVKNTVEEVSFVAPTKTKSANDAIDLKFELVKHVIAVRVKERDDREAAAERAKKKQEIMALIAKKEGAAMESQSIEDLRKQLESL